MVHCSAGVGRTGTFIVIDSLLERMEKEKTVNVYEFLTNMRRKRIQMVQTQVGGRGLVCVCVCECMYAKGSVILNFDNRLSLFGWLLFGIKCMALCVFTAVSLEFAILLSPPLPLSPPSLPPPPLLTHTHTQGQYVFIHDALEELITCGDTAILSHNLRHDIGKLGKIVPEKFITGFQNQFEVSNISTSYTYRLQYGIQTQTSSL